MKHHLFTILGGIFCSLLTHQLYGQCWTQAGENLTGEQQYENAGTSVCLSSNGQIVAYGSPQYAMNDGRVKVYTLNGNTWLQTGSDISSTELGDRFGTSVDLNASGTIVAVGASSSSVMAQSTGAFLVYEWNGNDWTQKGSEIYGDLSGQAMGKRIDISNDGTTIAVGAPFRSLGPNSWTTIGLTRVYRWNPDSLDWIQLGQDLTGFEEDDWFGNSLSLNSDGNKLAVGANFSSHFSQYGGYVTVYNWNGSSWEIDYTFEGSSQSSVGDDVALTPDGNTLILGASGTSASGMNSGVVRVYDQTAGSWVIRGSIPGESANLLYGISVAINESGSIICAGGRTGANTPAWSQRGFMNAYFWNGSTWEKIGEDIDGATDVEMLGTDVAISYDGNTIACGAPQSDYTVENAGHAAVYHSCVASTFSPEKRFMQISPNPTNSNNLLLTFNDVTSGTLQLFDYSGKLIQEIYLNNVDQYQLNVTLNPGSYQFILQENGKIYHEKLIKL